MENKLISMVDFVISQWSIDLTPIQRERIQKYANFLKQALKLGMFVPCDENDVPLVEPEMDMFFTATTDGMAIYENAVYDYQQAKDRVLFEGFEIHSGYLYKESVCLFQISECKLYTIEHLLSFEELDLTLTASAIKQFEL